MITNITYYANKERYTHLVNYEKVYDIEFPKVIELPSDCLVKDVIAPF